MENNQIAVLLTCHNRKDKTLACLASLFEAKIPSNCLFDIFLTDDGSTDGTENAVKELYPQVNVLKGDGSLFWAGGMRLAWRAAIQRKSYDVYLLINDDVRLHENFLINLIETDKYSLQETGKRGIYSGATVDEKTGKVSYGGIRIKSHHFVMKSQLLPVKKTPQKCEITNANILWVSKQVVESIGILDEHYTHGIADYDYSLEAHKKNIPVLLAPFIGGFCSNDHGKNWQQATKPLKDRIAYLKSPKGLAYSEYLYYIRKHFPLFLPYSFAMLWLKTFFPFIWDRFKN